MKTTEAPPPAIPAKPFDAEIVPPPASPRRRQPARAPVDESLRVSERAVLGTLLVESPADIPPIVQSLLQHAPGSFEDLRLGEIAKLAFDAISEGCALNVMEFQRRGADYGLLTELESADVGLNLLEHEAENCWQAYATRRTAQALSEASEALAWHPDRSGAVCRNLLRTIENLHGEATGANLDERLESVQFSPQNPPPAEPVLLEICGVPCATPGNMTTVTAQKKSGKSSFLSGIISAAISGQGDTLGVKAFNPGGKAVVHVDTEQSAFDHWKLCDSILRRGQISESALLKSFSLTGLSIDQRREAVFRLVRRQYESGGVFLAVIDGVADLLHNVNDPAESADFVASLHALAIDCRCHIINALHLNPGSDFKSRGHLGSELERKSQTNLKLEKADEIFVAWGDANRGAPIPKNMGATFAWCNEAKMHVSVKNQGQTKHELRMEEAKTKLSEAFRVSEKSALHWGDLIGALKRVPGINSDSSAERIFRDGKACGTIKKNLLQQWELSQ